MLEEQHVTRLQEHLLQPESDMVADMEHKLQLLDELAWYIALLNMRLKAVAQNIHEQGAFSGPRRSLLRNLIHDGPATVPQLARSRPTSRQFIQRLVNELVNEGLAEFVDNPTHRRSKRVQATPLGRHRFAEMLARETEVGAWVVRNIDAEQLDGALHVLMQVRDEFMSWQAEHGHAEDGDDTDADRA